MIGPIFTYARSGGSCETMWVRRIIHAISAMRLLCFRARLFIDALRSPAGMGLTFWLSFLMSNCEFVTFSLVSLVRYGT